MAESIWTPKILMQYVSLYQTAARQLEMSNCIRCLDVVAIQTCSSMAMAPCTNL